MGKYSDPLAELDFVILADLPAEGTKLGYHVIGKTISAMVRDKFGAGGITPDQLNGRMQALKAYGYVVPVVVVPTSQGKGWQITEAGQKALAAHQKGATPASESKQEVSA